MSSASRPELRAVGADGSAPTPAEVVGRRLSRHSLIRAGWLAAALLALVTVAVHSSFAGISEISFAQVMHRGIPAWPLGDAAALEPRQWVVYVNIRLPRIVAAILVGMALATAGCLMQIITANAMASPFTTGISNAAAFGAALAILTQGRLLGSATLMLVVAAFAAAGLCSIVVFGIAGVRGMGKASIVLTGIAISYLFSALSAGMQYLADEQQLSSIVNWTFGNLGNATWPQIGILAVTTTAGLGYAIVNARNLTLLSTGEDGAQAMGVDVARLRRHSSIAITLLAATAVSFTGVIGFVGLVAPHGARMLVGHDYRFTLPMAALAGALLLVVADLVGRTALSPVIVPVGIVVSLVGVPVFLWLILTDRGR